MVTTMATKPGSIRLVAVASMIGTTIEWYDFFLYGTAAALVFNRLFFPTFDPLVGTLAAFGTYTVGFVARPIGGIIIGHYGDRIGRKSMLVLTLTIMGVATFGIGLLPTYAQIGPWAAVALVVLRVAQGFGVGGEWGGAVLMAVEHAPPGARGFYGSWPQIGVPAGLLLSTAVFAQFTRLPEDQFLSWGWRVPFLLSVLLVGVGLIIRLRILETPAFTRVKQAGTEARRPIVEVLQTQRKEVLLAMGARLAENGAFYIYTVFVLVYGTQKVGIDRADGPERHPDRRGVRSGCNPFLRRAVRSAGTTTGLPGRRLRHRAVRVSAVLAARHGINAACVACARRGARLRALTDVRDPGRILVGAIRHARTLQRRFAWIPALVSDRGRALAVHCDGAAPVRTRRAGVVHHRDGADHHRRSADGLRDPAPNHRMISRDTAHGRFST